MEAVEGLVKREDAALDLLDVGDDLTGVIIGVVGDDWIGESRGDKREVKEREFHDCF